SGRTYVSQNGTVTTGISFANSGSQGAVISFYFTDANGIDFNRGSFGLAAGQQIAAFLNQPPFKGPSSLEGTFTFSSSVPVGVVAVHGLTNERGEFLFTTVPIAPLSTPSSTSVIVPDFADGAGWTTQLILVNPSDNV